MRVLGLVLIVFFTGAAALAVLMLAAAAPGPTIAATTARGAASLIVGVAAFAAALGVICAALLAYLLPTFVASRRGHLSVMAIGLANLLFGWTFIGWIACMIWALTGDTRRNRRLNFEG